MEKRAGVRASAGRVLVGAGRSSASVLECRAEGRARTAEEEFMRAEFSSLTIGIVLVGLSCGCGTSKDTAACTEASANADAFVNDSSNQQCETTADCVVESANCSEMMTARCGQFSLSGTAAASEEWVNLNSALDACPSSCSVCGAALTANCDNGLCRRPTD